MKNHHRLASLIFNTPQMVRDDMLNMAVHWANQSMNLNILNVGMSPAVNAWYDDEPVSAGPTPEERRLQVAQEMGVYIMPIYGVLVSRSAHMNLCETMTSYEDLRRMLNQALSDPAVEHIVMDIDSPGGSATGCMELSEEIFAARAVKPITAISNFGAYSAAYALASSASEVIVSRSSGVGSIGVIARHVDMSKRHEQAGIKITTVFAGARKNDLSSEAPITDEAYSWLTDLVQKNYDAFVQTVSRNRGLSAADVMQTEAGVFFGQDAVSIGLADRVETPQAAINRIAAQVAARRSSVNRISARAAAMNLQNCI
ncbi:S49 family peptidase [Alcaligenes aquatilis]|uniref:S49 family peptidase n=1 Tax=Alcaligenes aquatilis TaxID=323284 RepID=A0A3G2HX17_9BURK|nr:S49 family peptidase [Alcaligenes aquatilis]AYN21597.1 S49 family peptidase [Alcaligenes aquatilis]